MPNVRKLPMYISILLLSIAAIVSGEWLIAGSDSQMVWWVMLLPAYMCAYKFGLKGGLAFSLLILATILALRLPEAVGQSGLWQWLHLAEFAVILVTVSIMTSKIMHRLQHVRTHPDITEDCDPMTKLATRATLSKQLERYVKQNAHRVPTISCLFIDIDGFQFINGTYGHDAGDACLKKFAAKLEAWAKPQGYFAARFGGDEFVVVLPGADKAEAQSIARNLQSKLSDTYYWQNVGITFATGIASCPEDSQTIAELFQYSDIAMYQAKKDGKNRVRAYSPDSKPELLDTLQVEQDLWHALMRKQFHLVYQPQVSVSTGEIIGLEALLRWHHPDRGHIPPDLFIPVAERTGLIVPLGQWVLTEACRMCRTLQLNGFPELRIAVNVSPVQLQDFQFVPIVREALRGSGLAASSLELEITESIALAETDSETCIGKLRELKASGVRLAMDDFGSGYSSLNYLTRYPIDVVKLDKGFVQVLNESSSHAVLMQSLVELAHRLRLEVVAEGIENREQYDYCLTYACDAVQGYFTGRPMQKDGIEQFLQEIRIGKKAGGIVTN